MFAIFLRFVKIRMTQSREGNGCENGKWSRKNGRLHYFLYFHACGFHSVIQADLHRKGAVQTTHWPRATALHDSRLSLPPGALELCPLGVSPGTAADLPRKVVESLTGLHSALLAGLVLLCVFAPTCALGCGL